MEPAPLYPIIEEAAKKAAIAWLTVPGGGAAYPVWCLWQDGALHVVSGSDEQAAPGLAAASTALVTMRGDHGGRVVAWPADVSTVDPDSPQWMTIAPQLAAKRLNAPGPAEGTVARWAAGCTLSRLSPAAAPAEAGPSLPDDAFAAPPRPTSATRRPRRPFKLHRVRRT